MSPTDDPIEAARRDIATKFLKAHLEAFRLRRAFEALPSPATQNAVLPSISRGVSSRPC